MDFELALKSVQNTIGNFRDMAQFNQTYIKQNIIYRSATPIPHQSPELLLNLKEIGIKSIIDLRSSVEIGHSSYNDAFLHNFNYYWVHYDISMPPEILVQAGVDLLPFYKQFVWYSLFHNKPQIRRLINVISRPENMNFVMHCHAGRDRTGISSAIILLLLNAPEENIIQDYLATDEFTQAEDMEFLIEQVESVGGIEDYLVSCGIEQETLERIKERLRP